MLRVIEKEKLVEKARLQGNYLKERLLGLQKKYPLIGDVRGMGLMVGLELVTDARKTPAKEKRNRLMGQAFEKGLLLLVAGESSLRLDLPLIITKEQIDMGLSIIENCLKKIC